MPPPPKAAKGLAVPKNCEKMTRGSRKPPGPPPALAKCTPTGTPAATPTSSGTPVGTPTSSGTPHDSFQKSRVQRKYHGRATPNSRKAAGSVWSAYQPRKAKNSVSKMSMPIASAKEKLLMTTSVCTAAKLFSKFPTAPRPSEKAVGGSSAARRRALRDVWSVKEKAGK